jgi:hypothetical protein
MDHKEIGWENVDWIDVVHVRDKKQTRVNMVVNLRDA